MIRKRVAAFYLFIAALLVSVSLFATDSDSVFFQNNNENPLEDSSAIDRAVTIQKAIRSIYKEVNPSVVRIETEASVKLKQNPFLRKFFGDLDDKGGKQKRQGLGSGFIVHEDGYIVTNAHVIKNAEKIIVKFTGGQSETAKLIGKDDASDIALLKVNTSRKLRPVHFGDSDNIEVGDFAIAIGNPFGLSSTFTQGIVSSKSQELATSDGMPRIQTDTAINPGNSGGPLLNIRGEVIGINQMIYSRSGGSIGIGFAIPINYALEIMEKLKEGKKITRGFIGVSVLPGVSQEQLQELGIAGKTGLLVGDVQVGSPAWKSGLRAYDFITQVDGKKANKFSVLKSAVVRRGPGASLKLVAVRDQKVRTFNVKIGERSGK